MAVASVSIKYESKPYLKLSGCMALIISNQVQSQERPNVQNEDRRQKEASCIFVGLTSVVNSLQVIF